MPVKLLDRRKLIERSDAVEDGVIRKQFIAEIKACQDDDDDMKSRSVTFTISTGARDREGDIIDPKGWEIENYMRNPVVLFAHDNTRPPIGRATELNVFSDKLVATAEFMPPEVDTSGFSETIYRMVKAGYLNATSVGFLPKQWEFIKEKMEDDEEEKITGIKFLKQELLEFSVVPVPANPEALIGASKSGIDIHPLERWFEEALDRWTDYKDMVALPRKDLETLYTLTKGLLIKPRTPSASHEKTVITWSSAHPNGTMVADRNASWDGPAEVRRADVDDLMVMCAWREDKPRNELVKGDFKLPHHRASDKAVVWRGVVAAMAALLGARGGVDIPDSERRGVYRHLARHYREDFDEEPPSFAMVEQQVLRSGEYEMDFETGQVKKVEGDQMQQNDHTDDVVDKDAPPDETHVEKGLDETDLAGYVFRLSVGAVDVELVAPNMDDMAKLVENAHNMLDKLVQVDIFDHKNSDDGAKAKDQDEPSAVSGDDKDVGAQDKAQTAQPERKDAEDDLPDDLLEEICKELPSLVREVVNSEVGKLRGRVN